MLDRQRKYNIPLHLILLFCLLVIGIVTSGYVLYATQKAEFKKREYNNLSSIADLKVREIVNWRKERLADAHVVQQNLPVCITKIPPSYTTITKPDKLSQRRKEN